MSPTRFLNHSRMNRIATLTASSVILVLLSVGCGSTREPLVVTEAKINALRAFDALLPLEPDSIVELYRLSTPATFHTRYRHELEMAGRFIDSMNALLPDYARIDTLAIDHEFESFGEAGCTGRTIYLSSSYFLIYNDSAVICSILTHETGHVLFRYLPTATQIALNKIWKKLRDASLLYLFRDGEYSGNAKFGGHPYESPAELFASAFNLFRNQRIEVASRLRYVDPIHLPDIERLREIVEIAVKGS